jgi:glycosyltransferase involved in cell wall biosynthesis
MKIGIYFHGYPQEKGGGYTFEHEILLSLHELAQECRHDLVLFFENKPANEILTVLADKGLKVVLVKPLGIMPGLQRVISKILGKLHLSTLLKTPNPKKSSLDREKVEMVWFVADAYVPVREVNVPYIATVWDIQHRLQPWFPEVSQSGMWEWREDFYATFLRRAAYILTPNLVGQQELSLFYALPPERFRLLPYPSPRIDRLPDEKVNNVLAKYHLEKGYLFYPAGFWPHKNHANLLIALKALKNKFGETRPLVLVGSDKGNLEYVRKLVKTMGLEEQVHFLNFVTRDELIALYQGAYALTYLSLFGPENLPPLEAFQCNCPVIMSDYSGAREQIGDAVLFVNGLDPDAIADAIQDLEIKPGLRLALIKKGSKRAAQYTGKDYVRDVFKIFNEFEPVRHNWGSLY